MHYIYLCLKSLCCLTNAVPEQEYRPLAREVIPLIKAAEIGNERELKKLIEAGENVNEADNYGSTALIRAVTFGHLECCKILVDSGANVSQTCHFGRTALSEAANFGYDDIVKFLIQMGSTINDVDNNLETPLIRSVGTIYSTTIIRLLINAKANVNQISKDGLTPLMSATDFTADVEVVRMLLDAKAIMTHKNKDGQTAITHPFTWYWESNCPRKQKDILSCIELIIDRLMRIPNRAQVEKVFVFLKALEEQYGYDCREHVRPFLHAAIESENRAFPEESIAFREIRRIPNAEHREALLDKYRAQGTKLPNFSLSQSYPPDSMGAHLP